MRQRTFLLWTTVEQRKERETAAWRVAAAENGLAGSGPYDAHLLAAQSGLENDDEMLLQAEQEILKDVKRTFPWLENYSMREAATRNVLLAYAFRNPSVGYCQSLNYICGALLMVPLSEEDTFFSLCTLVEDMMPPDYYSAEHDILGARVDQLVFASVLLKELPRLASHLLELQCPISLFSIQWFMCLFAKDLPLQLTLRVWDVFFVYGDYALFAVAISMLQMGEAALLSCSTLEALYEGLKSIGRTLQQRDPEAAHRLVTRSLDALMTSQLVELIEVERVAKREQVVTEHLQQQQQWREIELETAAAAKAKAAAAAVAEAGESWVAEGGAVGEEAADGAKAKAAVSAAAAAEAAAAFVAQGDLAALGALGVAEVAAAKEGVGLAMAANLTWREQLDFQLRLRPEEVVPPPLAVVPPPLADSAAGTSSGSYGELAAAAAGTSCAGSAANVGSRESCALSETSSIPSSPRQHAAPSPRWPATDASLSSSMPGSPRRSRSERGSASEMLSAGAAASLPGALCSGILGMQSAAPYDMGIPSMDLPDSVVSSLEALPELGEATAGSAAAAAARAGRARRDRGLGGLITFMQRNRAVLKTRQAQLQQQNAELRAALAAKGLRAPSRVGTSLVAATVAATVGVGGRVDVGTEAPAHELLTAGTTPSALPHFSPDSVLHWYDAVFDVQSVSDVLHGGWTIRLSPFSLMRKRADRAAANPGGSERGDRGERDSASSDADCSSTSAEGASPGGSGASPGGSGAADGGALAAARAAAAAAAAVAEAPPAAVPVAGLGGAAASSITPGVTPTTIQDWDPFAGREAAVVGVLGLYNTGKTFLLNQLTGLALPSSKRVATRGLSLRSATLAGSTKITLVDSEGSLAPVAMRHAHSLLERQATEDMLDTITCRLSDYLIYVVEDYTSVDQRAVHRHSRALQESVRTFKDLIVVHNLRTITDEQALWHQWRQQVTDMYGEGEEVQVGVAVPGTHPNSPMRMVNMSWFRTHSVRHLVLASHSSALGERHNPAAITLLRMWLISAYVPILERRHGLMQYLLEASEQYLTEKLKRHVKLVVERSADPTISFVRGTFDRQATASPSASTGGQLPDASETRRDLNSLNSSLNTGGSMEGGVLIKLDQAPLLPGCMGSGAIPEPSADGVAADAAGRSREPRGGSGRLVPSFGVASPLLLQLTQDQSWLPSIDLYEGPKYYVVVMDVPAVGAEGLRLSRRGTLTHVLAGRTTPWREGAELLRTGRRYGSFQLLLRVPDAYLCKWSSCVVKNGVLRIRYPRDDDEIDLDVED